ncbi:NAD-dependent epimerase/dehydratase family protein [Peribacillus sp. SCS-26]|uniref:NAD-dependent epimerase/dehydratase family protein n=1 Tax=Paraperibacillus marinus TaxID=3115295 RepID=UPI003906140A
MKRAVVTGGAGFIGSHIVKELLRKGYEVAVIDNFSTGKRENLRGLDVSIYECDITSPEVMDLIVSLEPHYIIHQAAQVSVAESIQDIVYDEQVNVKGSLHVIKAAVKSRVKKLVFASSAAVYGNPVALPVSMNHPTRPESPYGLTKLTVENYLKLANKLYGLAFSILRYSNVYGPKQSAKGEGGVVAIFADRIQSGQAPVIFGDGEQTRDFIFVEDVAAANVKAIDPEGNISVNISSGKSISINELLHTINTVNGTALKAQYREERKGDIRHSLLTNDAAKILLDWEPAFDITSGLQETFKHTLNQPAGSL